jgi:hypothetical protein
VSTFILHGSEERLPLYSEILQQATQRLMRPTYDICSISFPSSCTTLHPDSSLSLAASLLAAAVLWLSQTPIHRRTSDARIPASW